MKKLIPFLLVTLWCLPVKAQTWSGIVAANRATDWTKAGLPATLPDGETATNPWTPPVRTQCGSTLPSSTSYAAINSALHACPTGTYVLLGPGTFSVSPVTLTLGNRNGVTLRGSGADSTKLALGSSTSVTWQNGAIGQPASLTWTAGFSQGTTVVTLSGATAIGTLLRLTGGGSTTDPGGVWVCSAAGTCSSQGGPNAQYETHYVTAVSGNSATISPPVSFPSFSTLASLSTSQVTNAAYGAALEDLTVDCTSVGAYCLTFSYTYASWMKGVRIVNGGGAPQLGFKNDANCLMMNNYFTQTTHTAEPMNPDTSGFNLFLNNIYQASASFVQGPGSTDVYAYNLARDAFNNAGQHYTNNTISNHTAGYSDILLEGNEIGNWQDDNIHGTTNLNTFFRNIFYGTDPPWDVATSHGWGIIMGGVARFENVIGNAIGNPNETLYKCTNNPLPDNCVIVVGTGPSGINDALSANSVMLWGNFDILTNAVRWCGNSSDPGWSTTCASTSEVPTSLSGNAAPYANPVPSSTTLPASFFMSTTAHPNGGTGLSWWKVCTNYPTCSTSQTQPFPPVGPDVTGGDINGTAGFPNYGGHAYHIPAYVAWKNLPIDTAYQTSYSITGSSWSGGTETLTISGLPSAFTTSGEFQVTGMSPSACNGTFMMTNSTTATVSYAVASNPGCGNTGTFKFPDIRQFNEAVYKSDPSGPAPAAPTNLAAVVQ